MMLMLYALMQVAPLPALPPEEDVVVIARKLNGWRGVIRTNPFGTKCVTRQSTGDAEIDAVGCTALERCWPATLPRMRAAHAKGVAATDRERMEAAATADFTACSTAQRTSLLDELHLRRAKARGSAS